MSTYPESQRAVLNEDLYHNYHPETVREKAVETYSENEDKRFIVHFMQPHGPYFGPKARKIRERISENHGIEFSAWVSQTNVTDRSDGYVYLMDAAKEGYITPGELKEIYVENLKLVLKQVSELLDTIDGKTVITADHGELMGDSTGVNSKLSGVEYEHPGSEWIPELRIVPWLVIESENRRQISSESPVTKEAIDDNTVEEHLRALGYKSE